MNKIMIIPILWQGDSIRYMKSSRTLQYKICMVERKEILLCFRANKAMIINNNSSIYSSCKCGSKFHRFSRTITTSLKTRMTQKKSKATKNRKTTAQVRTISKACQRRVTNQAVILYTQKWRPHALHDL